jgi:hypothetical protein
MDYSALITAVIVDVILTGLIVFYFQKRLESKLGRENTEHQIRFADRYAKRVKTFEEFYQKYIAFENAIGEMSNNAKAFMDVSRHPDQREVYKRDHDDMLSRFEDLMHFYDKNKLLLSSNANVIIINVIDKIIPIQTLVSLIANNPRVNSLPVDWMEMLPRLEEVEQFKDKDMRNPEVLLERLDFELARCEGELETLYESESAFKL